MPLILPITPLLGGGTTRMDLIEQTTAQRCGPYQQETVAASVGAAAFRCTSLMSSIQLGGLEDLYVLRRAGLPDDRVRTVKQYTQNTGQIDVDRGYASPPAKGELVEFHHLEPNRELRASVQAGLARCYFMDRVTIGLNGASAERDLTAAAYWITSPRQVYRAYFMAYNVLTQPREIVWAHAFEQDGNIWLGAAPDPLPYGLLVSARRPHSTWVNGADSTTGPLYDSDKLDVALSYAVAAAHVEAWRIARTRLQSAADIKMTTSQGEAALEFTRRAAEFFRPPARRVNLSAPFGYDSGRRPLSINSGPIY